MLCAMNMPKNMNRKDSSNISRNLFLYIRYSLVLGCLAGASIFLFNLFGSNKHIFVDVIHFIILSSVIPGYLILPGIIYKPFKRKLGPIPMDQILYCTFTVITLGFGPTLIYFLKYDSDIKAMLKSKENNFHKKSLRT